ncbi:diguanylate cyclase [Pusillimonas sp. NJUB218]|uniref:diguanylate cyclase n=1 Tax=Pusillimonas sp. NJUB218 TaxID=2023230 RepID=UPI000F4B6ACB|nr:diguanylate cyclase [Pusillimonas sp. NJUB218]ROT46490.1 hypothetical protein CHR62_00700 [Pusillimonas sp. NJUB218]
MLLDIFRREWALFNDFAGPGVPERVERIVTQQADSLASQFYDTMLKDPQAQQFLDHEQVRTRLRASLILWLTRLFGPVSAEAADDLYADQHKIGEVHARVDIPVALVLRGARSLKRAFNAYLDRVAPDDDAFKLSACRFFGAKIDLAMEVMSQAYASSSARKARSSEAYRLFSITENLATEKERQKAALLDWESQVMYETVLGNASTRLVRVRESEFGLWFRHKGIHAFQGVPEADVITQSIDAIDNVCLVALETEGAVDAQGRGDIVREIRNHARNIQLHLGSLFARSLELESGKDVLTRLLNRKFLPTVLAREIEHSRKSGSGFAVALIDIDHFKRINDNHGHEAGDQVIQQVAAVLSEHCRGGDFLFRMGGEEFLLVLVDLDAQQASLLCDRVRQAVQKHPFLIPDGTVLAVTVSIGLASHTGHPDYHYLLRQADEAVYEAKAKGRNRVATHAGGSGVA